MERKTYNILFIEDSGDTVDVILALLEHHGNLKVKHQQVYTEEPLIHALTSQTWDIILCDFVMPALKAPVAVEHCLTHQPQTPIILMSNRVSTTDVVNMMRQGVRAFVDKSDGKRLVDLVKHELEIVFTREQFVKTEKYYQSIVDNQTEFICRYNTDYVLTFVNRAYCEWQGVHADQLIGTNLMDKIPEAQQKQALANLENINKDNPTSVSLHQSILPNSDVRWIEWSDTAIFDDDDNIIGFQGVGRDVTERQATAKQILKLSEDLQSILDSMQDALVSVSLDDRQVIYQSASFEEVFGYPYERFRDDPEFFKSVVHPDDLEQALTAQAACLQEGFVKFDHRIIHPSGEVRWIHRRAWVNYDGDGKPLRVNDSARDITPQKLAEEALRDSEETYRLTLSHISDAVFITDDDGYFTFVCPNVHVMYSHTREELLEFGHISKALGDDIFDPAELKKQGEINNIERTVIDKSGNLHHVLVNVKQVEIDGGTLLFTVHDITDRKKVQDDLQLSETRLAEAQRIGHVGSWERNLVDDTLYWSDEVYRIFGLDKSEHSILIDMFYDAIFPEDVPAVQEAVQRSLTEKTPYEIVHRIVRPDGEIRYVQEYSETTYDADGTALRMIGTIQDITEQKQAEIALRNSEERYRKLVETMPIGIFLHHNDVIKYINPEGAKILGGETPADIIGKLHYDFIKQDDHAVVEKRTQRALFGESFARNERQVLDKQGNFVDVEFTAMGTEFDGEPAVQVVFVDITERKRAERDLREREEQLSGLINSQTNYVIRTDMEGYHTYANPKFAQEFAWVYGDGGIDGTLSMQSIMPYHHERCFEIVEKCARNPGSIYSVELDKPRQDGSVLTMIWEFVCLTDDAGNPSEIQCMGIDITERKKAEQEREEIEHRYRLISELLSDSASMYKLNDAQQWHRAWHIGIENDIALGYGKGKFANLEEIYKHIHPDDVELVKSGIQQTIAGEETSSEYRLLASDGTYRWFVARRKPIQDKTTGAYNRYIVTTNDITAKKEAEIALQENEKRYRVISELMTDSANMYKLDEHQQARRIWHIGIENDTVMGYEAGTFKSVDDIYTYIHPDDAESVKSGIRAVLAGEETTSEYRLRAKDGTYRWFVARRKPMHDEITGDYTHYIAAVKDITSQKEAEVALQENEELLRTVSNLMTDTASLYEINNKGSERVWQIGTSLEESLGYDKDTFANSLSLLNYIHPQDLQREGDEARKLRDGHDTESEFRLRASDGSYRWYYYRGHPIWNDDHTEITHFIIASKDITTQKQAELTLRENEKLLRTVSSLMTDTASLYQVMEDGKSERVWHMGIYVEELLGYDTDTFADGSNIFNYLHPEDIQITQVYQDNLRAGQSLEAEFRLRANDGSYQWIYYQGHPIWNDDHTQITHIIIAAKDINVEKQAELTLRDNERRFRIISELMSDTAIEYEFDEDGEITRVWTLGLDINEVLGYEKRTFESLNKGLQIIHPDDRNLIRESVAKTREGIPTQDEYRMLTNEGFYKWFTCKRQPTYAKQDGQVTGYMISLNDITEQKESELAIRESEQRFRMISELVSDSASQFHIDDDGAVTKLWEVGIPTDTLLGYTSNQFTHIRHTLDITHPDDRESQRDVILKTLDGHETTNEFRLRDIDGNYHWFLGSRKPIWDEEKSRVTDYVLAMKDIHERKMAVEALQVSETRFKQFMAHLPASAFVLTPDARFVYSNEAIAQSLGIKPEDLTNRRSGDFMGDEAHEMILKENEEVLAKNEAIRFEYIDPTDHKRYWDLLKFPIPQPDGTTFVGGIAVDVTEREESRLALQASETRYRQMFELIRVPQMVLNPQTGEIMDANPAAVDFYGYPLATLKSMNIVQVNQAKFEEIQTKMAKVIAGEIHSCDFKQKLADGTEVEVEVFSGEVSWNDKQAIYSVYIDVTKRNQADRERKQLNETLEQRVAQRTHELEKTKNQIEAIFNNSSDGILLFDLQRGILQANTTCDILLGTMFELYQYQPLYVLFAEDDKDAVNALIQTAIEMSVSETTELRVRLGDRYFYAEVTIATIPQTDESTLQMVCTIHDITERKQVEQIIAEERNMLRTLVDAIPEFIYVKDRDHRYIINNVAHTHSLGYDDPADVVGMTDTDIFPLDLANNFIQDDKKVFATQQSLINVEEETIGETGERIWALTSKIPLKGLDGQLRGLVGITKDITPLKQQEEALRQSEQRLRESENMLRLVLDTIPVRVFWKDRNSVFLGANDLVLKDANLSSVDEIIGKTDAEIFPTEADSYIADDHHVMTTGESRIDYEESQTTPTGDVIRVQTSKIPLRNTDGDIIGVLGTYTDITLRKQAEEQLRYLANIQEQIQDAVIGLDASYNVLSWNSAAEKMYGWSANEVIGKSLNTFIKTEYLAENSRAVSLEKLLRDGVWHDEVIQYHRDGMPINVLSSVVVERNEQGEILGFVGVNHDFTERKQAQEKVAESEARYRLLAENVSDVIMRHTPDGTIKYISPSIFQLIGITAEDIIGRQTREFIYPNDIQRNPVWHLETEKRPTIYTNVYRLIHANGDLVWVETTSTTLRENGNAVEVISVTRDITERRKSEEVLRSLSQRLELATSAGGIGVWDWNIQTDELYWDDQMLELYDMTREDFNKTFTAWFDVIHPDDFQPTLQAIEATIEGTQEFNTIFRIVDKQHNIRFMQVFAQVDRDQEDIPLRMVGVALDVTDVREAQEALLSALEQEKELGELKSRFVSMASHEFRTPLAGIMATVETLKRFRGRMIDIQIDERLDKINVQVNHMKTLIDDVLRLTRLQAGRVDFRPDHYNVDDLCREVMEELQVQPGFKGRIDYRCDANLPLIVELDRQLIRQIITNLLHNGLKYSDEHVHLTILERDKDVMFTIKDQGIGIPQADLKRLFEPFHRATNVGTRQGTGLGLSIVKQAIEVHHGTIDVQSEVNQGTTFIVTLPINQKEVDNG